MLVLVRTLHLGCFGGWFGAQVWTTFFAGKLFWYLIKQYTQCYLHDTCLPRTNKLGVLLQASWWACDPSFFVLGLTMMKYLPRHTFGYVQSKVLPKYFRFGVILSGVSLVTFVIDNPVISTWNFEQKLQVNNCLRRLVHPI